MEIGYRAAADTEFCSESNTTSSKSPKWTFPFALEIRIYKYFRSKMKILRDGLMEMNVYNIVWIPYYKVSDSRCDSCENLFLFLS